MPRTKEELREYRRRREEEEAAKAAAAAAAAAAVPSPTSSPAPQPNASVDANAAAGEAAAPTMLDHVVLGLALGTWLKTLIWLLLLLVFIELEFAAVFLCASGLLGMYLFTEHNRHRRKPGELSAYSVFNANHERIAGTFDVEEYENVMRYAGVCFVPSSPPDTQLSTAPKGMGSQEA